eukprot:TCALIF_00992-PA protein Name:"Similar to METTL15 Probable methyltransferase-like protein 15 (Bos taurus)" AED:0.07 eAED:0.07 QI:0/0/0/1/1/1/2/0/350
MIHQVGRTSDLASNGEAPFASEIIKHLGHLQQSRVLDMTFGTGRHAKLILEHDPSAMVIAVDADRTAWQAAQAWQEEVGHQQVIPLRARFSELPAELQKLSIEPQSLDCAIIETGCSDFQLHHQRRGFNHARDGGMLDLRLDPDLRPQLPSGSEILQRINEKNLNKILKYYGGSLSSSKHVTQAIIESRYMFHSFKSVEELYEVLEAPAKDLAKKTAREPEDMLVNLVFHTILALRKFINDELNEFEYALRVVAENYLKPNGILFVISSTMAEDKIVQKVFQAAQVPAEARGNFKFSSRSFENFQVKPWEMIAQDVQGVKKVKAILNPKFKRFSLVVVRRTDAQRSIHIL